ncbi:hypothetical protein NQ314_014578 [Rhamnusium bicolor]|uniref:Transposable element P transposase-like C-terminal domain-containing protein n=1 Tax=Rhamnusium bicolor TaxID=1586634 RepID=A0AAV8X205_9CUCU|nr:hypothetical protein NQ314_014578 [Rhamnusium bicolor]
MIILGKNSGILDAKVNTKELTTEEYMTPQIFEKVRIEPDQEKIHDMTFGSKSSSSFSSSDSLTLGNESSSNIGENVTEMKEDALEYISGWLAKKYKKECPSLGRSLVAILHLLEIFELPRVVPVEPKKGRYLPLLRVFFFTLGLHPSMVLHRTTLTG